MVVDYNHQNFDIVWYPIYNIYDKWRVYENHMLIKTISNGILILNTFLGDTSVAIKIKKTVLILYMLIWAISDTDT